MQIPTRARPELCSAKEESRYSITTPFYTGNGTITATDGRCLVQIPVIPNTGEEEHAGPIPLKAFKAGRKTPVAKHSGSFEIMLDAEHAMVYGDRFQREAVQPPDADAVVKHFAKAAQAAPTFKVRLNAKYLASIAAAMDVDQVELEMVTTREKGETVLDTRSPVAVRPIVEADQKDSRGKTLPASKRRGIEGAFGLLMPIG